MKIGNWKLKIILFLIVIAVLFFIFYFSKSIFGPDEIRENLQETKFPETLEYKNIERGFTLKYPKELSIKDYDEGDTTHTIVFSDPNSDKSFQLFFTPYYGDQITQSRILKDVPNGKFTEPVEIVINGSIRAIAFFSEGDLGEMREVWFLHDGYLYEVTAYKDLDEWLANIMETWEFFQNSPAGGQ